MRDLISRQAAIDAADRADYIGLAVEDVKKVTDEVVKELKKLPSAQQWTPCSACVHYTAFGNGCGTCAIHATKTSFERMCNDNDFCSWAERKGGE